MKKAVLEIIKKLQQTAAGKKMTPKQLESRAKMDYKDTQDYKARIAKEDKSFSNQMNRELAAKQNLKDPKNKAMLNAKEREMEKYIPGYKGKTYKKGGMAKKKYEEGGEVDTSKGVKGRTSSKAKKDQFNFQRGYAKGLSKAERQFNIKGKVDTTEDKADKAYRGKTKFYQGEVKGKSDMKAALKGQGAYKKGGKVYCKDGCAVRGKTKGKLI